MAERRAMVRTMPPMVMNRTKSHETQENICFEPPFFI